MSLKLPFSKTRGLWVLAADDMVNYVLADTTEAFEVILLADKAPGSKNFNAAITVDEDAHKALEQLMRAGD